MIHVLFTIDQLDTTLSVMSCLRKAVGMLTNLRLVLPKSLGQRLQPTQPVYLLLQSLHKLPPSSLQKLIQLVKPRTRSIARLATQPSTVVTASQEWFGSIAAAAPIQARTKTQALNYALSYVSFTHGLSLQLSSLAALFLIKQYADVWNVDVFIRVDTWRSWKMRIKDVIGEMKTAESL
jgi:hypothetical protein